MMLAGGADAAIIPSGIGGFIACKALSKRNDSPETASRPWDKHRDGFVMGEGAGQRSMIELTPRNVADCTSQASGRQGSLGVHKC